MKKVLSLIALLILIYSCGNKIPTDYIQSESLPRIYPDYVNVTVPVNIAPLTFQMDVSSDEMAVRYSFADEEIICCGAQALPDIDDWRRLASVAQGQAIQVETYVSNQGQWTRYKPFNIYVSPEISLPPYTLLT